MDLKLLIRSKIVLFVILINCGLVFGGNKSRNPLVNISSKKIKTLSLDNVKSIFNVNVTLTQVTATCANNGSITASASGATATPSSYVFRITNGPTANGQTYPFTDHIHESTYTFNDLYPGVYEVTVIDADNSSNPPFVGNITVLDETELLDFSTSSTNPNCPNDNTGTLTVNVSSGVGPYQYQIIDGPAGTITSAINEASPSYTFNNLPSGNYRIRVFDVCGDFQTRNASISAANSSTVILFGNGINRISCTESVYSVSAFGQSGSITYEVVGGAPAGYDSTNTTGDFLLPHDQAPYTISVTSTCGQTSTYTHNNRNPFVNYQAGDKTCTNWDLILNPNNMVGPYTFTLTSTPVGYAGIITNTTGQFNDLPYGNYGYTVTDSCGDIVSGNSEVLFKAVEINPNTDAEGDSCSPGQGSVVINYNSGEAVGPVSFELTTVPVGYTGNPGPQNGNVFNGLTVGDYEVTAIDACGNVDTHTFDFEASDALEVEFNISVTQGCINEHSIQVSVTTNSGSFGFQRFRLINASNGNSVSFAAAFFGPANFDNIPEGDYYIEYDIFAGCSVDSENFTIEPYAQPSLTPLSSYSCSDDTVTISGITQGGIGPFTYSLINSANNEVLTTNTECFFDSQDSSLVYAVRIEDNCGNSSSAQVTPLLNGLGLELLGETCAAIDDPFSIYVREYSGVEYNWTFPDGTNFIGSDPRSVIGVITSSDYGEYNIVASTINGCNSQSYVFDFNACIPIPVNASIDFDGIDDYVDSTTNLGGNNQITVMAWLKIDELFYRTGTVISQGDFKILVNSERQMVIRLNNQSITLPYNTEIPFNEWVNIAVTFDATLSSNNIKIYIDGELISSISYSNPVSTSSDLFTIGKDSANDVDYFKGDIDEVRVFDVALSKDQLRKVVYQEIQENSGFVSGVIVPKAISDFLTNATIPWSNVIGYYPMTSIENSATPDFSNYNNEATLHNITTILEQTAPMPFATKIDGNLIDKSTFVFGDVWNINNILDLEWTILQIKTNVSLNSDIKTGGLIIDEDKELVVLGDHLVKDSWYLELNGTIDLREDSQLIQGENSDLVTSATGKILRRQEGNSSVYWYNYWASPVGGLGASALSDNNLTTSNPNNSNYNLGMLKKPNGDYFEFTGALNEVGKISVYWLYTYKNGVTYYDYAPMDANSQIEPGVGYTQKGTGVGSQQRYIFEGKPNNGTIIIPVLDTGGEGSVPAESKTDFLFGNPYASAIDLHKFIDDNAGIIDGTIQLWQQWSGSSHYLDEYDGGYAQVNKLGSVRAYQFVGIEGENNGSQDGTKTPSRYLPVGQGFITEIIADGNVVFNNSQRLFIKEADADGSYNNGSIFFRGGESNQSRTSINSEDNNSDENNLMQKLRLEFNSVDGPSTRRELLLGFSEDTSDDYDYGYDSKNAALNANDLGLVLEDEVMTIQAYSPIEASKIIPMVLKSSGNYNYTLKITETENIDEDQDIYVKDNLTGTYFNLRNEQPYEFSSETGEFNDRLEIVFQQESETLSQVDQTLKTINFYYTNNRNKIVVLNPNNENINAIEVINMLGQSVYNIKTIFEGTYNEYDVKNLTTGTYIIRIMLDNNSQQTKKVIINQ